MASRSKKQDVPVERKSATIGMSLEPAYAIKFDHPNLSGHTAIGISPEKAMTAARGLISSKFPESLFDVEIKELTPDRFNKVGVHFDPEGSE